ncbi:MAG TPA: hypothetical protein PKW59_06845 [Thermotogota bacterium]|nr:hypothetical protein [Thermotogota bacterium]
MSARKYLSGTHGEADLRLLDREIRGRGQSGKRPLGWLLRD